MNKGEKIVKKVFTDANLGIKINDIKKIAEAIKTAKEKTQLKKIIESDIYGLLKD